MRDEGPAATDDAGAAAASPPALEILGVSKTYGRGDAAKSALRDVSLTVPAGEIFGLLGPNGAGKSTLINILAGLTIKSSGTVRIWGFDQDVNPRMSRASIGVVHQELHIDPFLTPKQSMDIQAGLYGVPAAERRTAEILEALGLADKTDAYARTLSGGMRRRLMVAKAMVHSPPVLVLDEPTAGVDIDLRRQLWDHVAELNRAGVTIILTTHYLEEAEQMCGRIAILNHGRIVAEAPTAELIDQIDRKTLVVAPSGSVIENALRAALPAGVLLERRADGRLALGYRARVTPIERILTALGEAGVGIADLSTEEAHLEDVFLEMTRDDR